MKALPLALFGALAAVVLSACSDGEASDGFSYTTVAPTDRSAAYASSNPGIPFQNGTVHVVAEERGELKTYKLVLCRGGSLVCAEGLNGRAGQLVQGADYVSVTGAYSGRTFRLAPGGTGQLVRGGVVTPLAWE